MIYLRKYFISIVVHVGKWSMQYVLHTEVTMQGGGPCKKMVNVEERPLYKSVAGKVMHAER